MRVSHKAVEFAEHVLRAAAKHADILTSKGWTSPTVTVFPDEASLALMMQRAINWGAQEERKRLRRSVKNLTSKGRTSDKSKKKRATR